MSSAGSMNTFQDDLKIVNSKNRSSNVYHLYLFYFGIFIQMHQPASCENVLNIINSIQFETFCKSNNLNLVKKVPCCICQSFTPSARMKERVGCLHQVCLKCSALQVCVDYCGECYGSHEPEFFISDESEMNIANLVGSTNLVDFSFSTDAEEAIKLCLTSNNMDLEML